MKDKRRIWQKVWPSFFPTSLEVKQPLSERLREAAIKHGSKTALDFYGQRISYHNLNDLIDRFAVGVLRLGLGKGDRVALHMQNCPQFVISYFGILRAGGVVVCLNPMFKHAELEYEIVDSNAVVYVGLDYLYSEVESIRNRTGLKIVILTSFKDFLPENLTLPPPPEANKSVAFKGDIIDFQSFMDESNAESVSRISDMHNELALLQYTGGTTGLPKGAMITHHALSMATIGSQHWFNNNNKDVVLGVTPFFHIMGMVQMMCAPLLSGGKIVVLSRFEPNSVAKAIQYYRCNAWVGATTMLISLLQLPNIRDYHINSFRYICTGGSPISIELQRQIQELMPNADIMEGYGLTECVSQGGAITPMGHFKPGYVGVPNLNDIKIMDLKNRDAEAPVNEAGEIAIKGPILTKGYWNQPEETDAVIRDGWFHTGDIGAIDEQGYLQYAGRLKELIKCSGFSVFPSEVEDLLYRHPAIAEVAVKGVHDPYRGESPKAYVVLKHGFVDRVTEGDLIEWCKENMAAYKRPREFEFVNDLPKSAVGKVLRRLL